MALQSPVDYLRKKEDSILPDDDTSNAEFLDPQELSSEDENTYGSQGGGTGSDSFDDDGMEAGRTVPAKTAFAGPAPKPTAPPSPTLDPSAYNAASQKVADITGQKPGAPKPKWWQRLAAGAAGGLAGFSNAEGKAGPQINPAAAEDALLGGPQSRRQLSDWQRQVDAATAQQSAEAGKLSAAEKIQRVNAEAEMRKAQKDAADYRLEREKRLENAQPGLIHSPNYIYDPVTKRMVWQNTPAQPKSPATYEAYLVAQLQSPDPKVRADAQQKLDAIKAKAEPRPSGHWAEDASGNVTYLPTPDSDQPVSFPGKGKGREPKEPSAASLNAARVETVRQLAQRALRDSKAGGGTTIDHAIGNVKNAYADDPEMDQYRMDVIERLNRAKLAGIRPDKAAADLKKAESGGAFEKIMGANPANPQAPTNPQAPAQPRAPTGPQAPPKAQAPPKEVTDSLPAGRHTFANGQVWDKDQNGKMTQVQ